MPQSVFFTDDSRQQNPSRPGMTSLVATGAIRALSDRVRDINLGLDNACREAGFPSGEEFKWSPGRELWMHSNLVGNERRAFFSCVSEILQKNSIVVVVVIEDVSYARATNAASHEMDATTLLIERLEHQCIRSGLDALIIADRPGGHRRDEDKFLSQCLETLQSGTDYVTPTHIIHNVVSTPSKLSRLIQAADFVTGCTLAYVSGENVHSPPIFSSIQPLLDSEGGRIGGVGLKLHPDLRFVNLYHWLVGDTYYRRGGTGHPLPMASLPYYTDQRIP